MGSEDEELSGEVNDELDGASYLKSNPVSRVQVQV